MSLFPTGAILVADLPAGIALMPVLAQRRPDLRWTLVTDFEQAVFEACAGSIELAVFDADRLDPGCEQLLRQVARCAPSTRLLVHARNPASPDHAALAACGWLTLVPSTAIAGVLGDVA
jgi:hypothetical protein